MNRITLAPNEKLLHNVGPAWIAFIDLYFLWTVVFLCSLAGGTIVLGWVDRWISAGWLSGLEAYINPRFVIGLVAMACTSVVLFPVIFIAAFKRINASWLWGTFAVGAGMLGLLFLTRLELQMILLLPAGISVVGIALVDLYRSSHRFIVTQNRMIFVRSFPLFQEYYTESYYHHITNIVVRRTWLERAMKCGTVIPIMSSGLNLGSEVMRVSARFLLFQIGTERTKVLPRAIPHLSLYCVRGYQEIVGTVSGIIAGASQLR